MKDVLRDNSTILKENKNLKIGIRLLNSGYFQLKKTTQKLRESEEMFSKAFSSSPYILTITNPKDGVFIDVNDAFIATSGYSKIEATSSSSIDLKIWVNLEERKKIVDDLLNGKSILNHECQFRIKNGEILTTLLSAQIIHIGGILAYINSLAHSGVLSLRIVLQEVR